jgi:two-component system, LytTR family, sensor kinase
MEQAPYKKMIRVSLAVVPLFGIIAATPALLVDKGSLSNIPVGFAFITLAASFIAAINLLLVRFSAPLRTTNRVGLRYAYSAVCCTLLISGIYYLLLHSGLLDWLMRELPPEVRLQPMRRQAILLPMLQGHSMNLVFFILMEMVMLRDKKQHIERENSQLRLANLEARNQQLKQQLDPHFLFNSLNTLRTLIKRQPDQAEEYLVKLSDLLRFSITGQAQATVKLADELALCHKYLEMQQVRFGEALQFDLQIPAALQWQYSVPVYAIQLLLENAIKHNVLTAAQPLYIQVEGNLDRQTITVRNNLQAKKSMAPVSGLGLANLAERYDLLGNLPVDIQKSETQFSVTIHVLANESDHH